MGAFTAHCQNGHDRITFDGDREGFERHMREEHGRKPLTPGGAIPTWREGMPNGWTVQRIRTAAPGMSAGRILEPHPWKAPRAPRGDDKLTEALARWADEPWPIPRRWHGPNGPSRVLELEGVEPAA